MSNQETPEGFLDLVKSPEKKEPEEKPEESGELPGASEAIVGQLIQSLTLLQENLEKNQVVMVNQETKIAELEQRITMVEKINAHLMLTKKNKEGVEDNSALDTFLEGVLNEDKEKSNEGDQKDEAVLDVPSEPIES